MGEQISPCNDCVGCPESWRGMKCRDYYPAKLYKAEMKRARKAAIQRAREEIERLNNEQIHTEREGNA